MVSSCLCRSVGCIWMMGALRGIWMYAGVNESMQVCNDCRKSLVPRHATCRQRWCGGDGAESHLFNSSRPSATTVSTQFRRRLFLAHDQGL